MLKYVIYVSALVTCFYLGTIQYEVVAAPPVLDVPIVVCPTLEELYLNLTTTERMALMQRLLTDLSDEQVAAAFSWKWSQMDYWSRFDFVKKSVVFEGILLFSVILFFCLILIFAFYKSVLWFFLVVRRNRSNDIPFVAFNTPTPSLHEVDLTQYVEESRVAGSSIQPDTSPPACQVKIYDVDGIHLGNGFRDEKDVLVTAFHIIKDLTQLYIGGSNDVRKVLSVSSFKWVNGIDLAFCQVPSGDWANLGIQTAIYPNKYSNGDYVSVHSGYGFSVGSIQDTFSPEMVRYTASTEPGFSGSVYYSGRKVYGLHLGGGEHNVGYPFPYVIYVRDNLSRLTELAAYSPEKNKGKNKKNRKSKVSDDAYIGFMLSDAKKSGKKVMIYRSMPAPEAPFYYYGRNRIVEVSEDLLDDPSFEIVRDAYRPKHYTGEVKKVDDMIQNILSYVPETLLPTMHDAQFLDLDPKPELTFLANPASAQDKNLASVQKQNTPSLNSTMKSLKDQASKLVLTAGLESTVALRNEALQDISKLTQLLQKTSLQLQAMNEKWSSKGSGKGVSR